jgi:hypothetical protein
MIYANKLLDFTGDERRKGIGTVNWSHTWVGCPIMLAGQRQSMPQANGTSASVPANGTGWSCGERNNLKGTWQ